MARNRSRRPSDRNRAAARPHGLHVKRKYARVNRRRRVTVRGKTTVSKASHRTVAIRTTLRRNATRCTGEKRYHEDTKGTKTHEKPKVSFVDLRAFVMKDVPTTRSSAGRL